jgi:hypothetical protein
MQPSRFTPALALVALLAACERSTAPVAPAPDAIVADLSAQPEWSEWSAPVNLGSVINTPANEQHPAISKDGRSLYFSADRPGGYGMLDLWVSQRPTPDAPWGPPVNLGPTINTAGIDQAPTFSPDGHHLYFHSNGRGGCGAIDLFVARRHDKRDDLDWQAPENLGCVVNSAFDDAGPTILEDDAGVTTLIFTSTRPGGPGNFDIYQSTRAADGTFGPATLVSELSAPFRDTRTAVSRDGLTLFMSSDVTGRIGGIGGQDLWMATRPTTSDPWSVPSTSGRRSTPPPLTVPPRCRSTARPCISSPPDPADTAPTICTCRCARDCAVAAPPSRGIRH